MGMKLSDLIKTLEQQQAKRGDLEFEWGEIALRESKDTVILLQYGTDEDEGLPEKPKRAN